MCALAYFFGFGETILCQWIDCIFISIFLCGWSELWNSKKRFVTHLLKVAWIRCSCETLRRKKENSLTVGVLTGEWIGAMTQIQYKMRTFVIKIKWMKIFQCDGFVFSSESECWSINDHWTIEQERFKRREKKEKSNLERED